jgi:hypothetical protein
MSERLVVCPGCIRHVRADESACPFCALALNVRPLEGRRVGATLAAAFVGIAATACNPSDGAPPVVPTNPPEVQQPSIDAGATAVDPPKVAPPVATDSPIVEPPKADPLRVKPPPVPPRRRMPAPVYGSPPPRDK